MREERNFADIFQDHVWDVYGFVAYRVRSTADAEDITQQTFERALRAWGRFDPERASAKTWLIAIARNLVIDHGRRGRERREVTQAESLDTLESPYGGPTEAVMEPGVEPELEAALGRLSDRDREALALRFGGDLTGPEIAEELGISLANVQQILSRALRRLRLELEGRAASEDSARLGRERADASDSEGGGEQKR